MVPLFLDLTYLPVRAICEAIGKDVGWIDETKSVLVGTKPESTRRKYNVNIYLDGTLMEDTEGVIIDGSTYLPVRALCEALYMNVEWDAQARCVYITKKEFYDFFNSPGFISFDESVRKSYSNYIETTLPYGEVIRSSLRNMIENNDYYSLQMFDQFKLIENFMYNEINFQVPDAVVTNYTEASFTISEPIYQSSFDVWRGTMKPVWAYQITMDGTNGKEHKWVVYSTDKSPEIVEIVAKAVSRYPYAVRQYIHEVVYDYDSANTYWGGGNKIWMKLNYIPSVNSIYANFGTMIGYLLEYAHSEISSSWLLATNDDDVPVSQYGETNEVYDLGEFTKLYFSLSEKAQIEELENVYPNRFRLFAAMLYQGDNEYYAEYKSYYDLIVAPEEEKISAFTISIPGTNLYLTAPSSERGQVTFKEYTGEENQMWYKKENDFITGTTAIIYSVSTKMTLIAVAPYERIPGAISLSTTEPINSYAIVDYNSIMFPYIENLYLSAKNTTSTSQAVPSKEKFILEIKPVE